MPFKVHIVYLNPVAQLGGAETSLLDLVAEVRRSKPSWRITVILAQDGPLVARMQAVGAEVQVEAFPRELATFGDSGLVARLRSFGSAVGLLRQLIRLPFAAWSCVRRLRRQLESLQPTVIHATGFKMHVLSAWASGGRFPLIWHFHDYVSSRALMRRLVRRHASAASLALANSNRVAADVRRCCPESLDVQPVYNFLSLDSFRPDGERMDLDGHAGLPAASPATIRIGLAGTFARWKGHGVFLEALSFLPKDLNFRAYIIGASIYQTAGSQYSLPELQSEAARLQLQDRVGFTGFIDDLPKALRTLDVVVHCSTSPEPMGMVILEGMACGKAVIATRDSGAAEIFEEGVSALAHQAGDARDLARQIERVVRNADLRRTLGEAARICVEKAFGNSRLRNQVLSIYSRFERDGEAQGPALQLEATSSR